MPCVGYMACVVLIEALSPHAIEAVNFLFYHPFSPIRVIILLAIAINQSIAEMDATKDVQHYIKFIYIYNHFF